MKTFKLILKSLISNNSCIDGARKKPWWYATIMFVFSMIIALVPLFVQTIKSYGDNTFQSNTYGADVAMLRFEEYLEDKNYTISVVEDENEGKIITAVDENQVPVKIAFPHYIDTKNAEGVLVPTVDYWFFYTPDYDSLFMKSNMGDTDCSYVVINKNNMEINFSKALGLISINCVNATKHLDVGTSINDLFVKADTPTESLNKTFANWKSFIRLANKFTRLDKTWKTTLLFFGVNTFFTILMGFLVWCLTRGKNNPYRLFNLWETQKMSWWCAVTPAVLALGLGFLIKNFAPFIFPMCIGVRVMWLSMRSLKPDGSGYAESD